MALSISQTAALGPLLREGARIAAFGYPDAIAPLEMFKEMLGERFSKLEYRLDSDAICKRHGLRDRDIPDSMSFFQLMGCSLVVYDIVKERGCEVLCDLNKPMNTTALYDIVLDVGTIEHCFNIAQAAINMANLVKLGGVIIHENPFLMGNHGFYGMNPTWYADFYGANGFELLDCRLTTRDGKSLRVPPVQRFVFTSDECNVFAMAKRLVEKTMVYPTQSKYAKLIPAAEERAELKEAANG